MNQLELERFLDIKAKFEDQDSPKSVWRDKVDAFDFFNENFEFLINIIETHIWPTHYQKKYCGWDFQDTNPSIGLAQIAQVGTGNIVLCNTCATDLTNLNNPDIEVTQRLSGDLHYD